MPQSLVNFDGALKDNYGPGLKNSVNNMNPIVTEIGFNDQDILGRKAVWSIHTGQSSSTGNRAELATLPTADRQRYVEVNDALVAHYHTIKVSGQADALTKGDVGSFLRALEAEMDGAQKDITRDYARQILGTKLTDGTTLQSGALSVMTAKASPTVTFGNATVSEMRYFFKNERISFIDPATGNVRATGQPSGGYTVASINQANRTVTTVEAIDATVGTTDYVVRFGNWAQEINGLRFLMNPAATYAGLAPATEPNWAPVAVGSATTQISELIFSQAEDIIETDGDGLPDDGILFVAAVEQCQKLATILQAQKRYDGRDVTLKGGFKGVQIANGVLVRDRYCPVTFAAGLDRAELSRFVGLDWSWDDGGGSVLFKALDGSDAVEGRYKTYHQFVTTNRNSHVQITLAVPSL